MQNLNFFLVCVGFSRFAVSLHPTFPNPVPMRTPVLFALLALLDHAVAGTAVISDAAMAGRYIMTAVVGGNPAIAYWVSGAEKRAREPAAI